MVRSTVLLGTLAFAAATLAFATGEEHRRVLPHIEAPTLTGRWISLPAAAKGRPSVVLLGFSKSAGHQAQEWVKQLTRDFHSTVGVYQVPVIEALPRVLRGLAQRQMRQITPQSLYDQVLLLDKGESAWRSFLRHKNEDDIHVIVLDAEGHIVYRHEGPFSEGAYRAVKPHLQQLEQLAGQPGAPPSASAQ